MAEEEKGKYSEVAPDGDTPKTLVASYWRPDPEKYYGVRDSLYTKCDYNELVKPLEDTDPATGGVTLTLAQLPDPISGKRIQLPSGDTTTVALGWAISGEGDNGLVRNAASDYGWYQSGTQIWRVTDSGFYLPQLTQGSVLFVGASGLVSQDNTNLFWDDTDNFLRLTSTAGKQLRLSYDANNYWDVLVSSSGILNLNPASTNASQTMQSLTSIDGSKGIIWTNTSSGASASSFLGLSTAGSGDAYAIMTAGTSWAIGVDNSDSDKFKISKSTALGTNDYFVIDTSGNVTFAGSVTTALTASRVVVTDSSSVLTTGPTWDGTNLGVNTTGPDRRLDVLDASNPQVRLTHTDGTVYAELQSTTTGFTTVGVPSSAGNYLFRFRYSAANIGNLSGVYNQTLGSVSGVEYLAQYGVDRFFDSSGCMYVGTNAPAGIIFSADNSNAHWKIAATGGLTTGGNYRFAHGTSALATNATEGFFHLQSCAGTPSGTPASIPTGQIPLVWDSTNNILYAYDGGWVSTSGSGGTLDQAYDSGGAGAGRTITVDSGAVRLTGSGTTAGGFLVDGSRTIASAAGATWNEVLIDADVSISGSTNITTATGFNMVALNAPTITDAGTVTSISLSSTLYIGGAPTGSGVTLTDTYALWVDSGVSRFDGQLGGSGSTSAASPSLCPNEADLDTGIYSTGSNVLDITTGGGNRVSISSSGITLVPTTTCQGVIRVSGGNVSSPALCPSGTDTNSGIYSVAEDSIGISCGGALRFAVNGVNPASTAGDANYYFPQATNTSGADTGWLLVGAAHTGQTASTEVLDVDFDLDAIMTHATGAITDQRSVLIRNRTHAFAGASTVTRATTLAIVGSPVQGTNATYTTSLAFWVAAGGQGSFNTYFGATPSMGGGIGVIGIANAGTNPSTNPTGGGILYSNAGAGTWRGSGGTVTAFGPAGPHCGDCGYDEWTVATLNTTWQSYRFVCGHCGATYSKGPQDVHALLSDDQRKEYLRRDMDFSAVAVLLGVA